MELAHFPSLKSVMHLFRLQFFVGQMPWGIFNPFLVVYLSREVGLSGGDIGMMFALGGMILVLTQQIWGYLADVIISRRTLLLITTMMSGLLFWAFRYTHSFSSVLMVYGVFYLFNSALIQLQNGFFLSYRDSAVVFPRVRAYASVGYGLANISVALVADHFTNNELFFIFPYYMVACLVLCALTLKIPDTQPVLGIFSKGQKMVGSHARVSFIDVQRFFLKRPEVVFFLLVAFVYQLGHSLSNYLLALVLDDMQAGNSAIGFNTALGAILEAPIFFISIPLIKRFGEARLIAFAGLVQALRWILVWNADSPSDVITASLLHCVTFGLFFAASVNYMNRKAGEYFKASAQTLYALVVSGLGIMFGNFLSALIAPGGRFAAHASIFVTRFLGIPDHGELLNLYLICGLTALISSVLAMILWRIDKAVDA